MTDKLGAPSVQRTSIDECWNRTGAMGDRSCPELPAAVHCRNCSVFTAAGQQLFEREPSTEYLEECTRQLAEEVSDQVADTVAVVIFRLGEEWLACNVGVVVEVAEPRVVHRIPHRSNELLLGIVNIRGELQLCISLRNLLGIDDVGKPVASESSGQPTAAPAARRTVVDGALRPLTPAAFDVLAEGTIESARPRERLLVVESDQQRWAFPVDEIAGVIRVAVDRLGNVPATVANSLKRFSRAVFPWEGKSVGCLADERVFESLNGGIIR